VNGSRKVNEINGREDTERAAIGSTAQVSQML